MSFWAGLPQELVLLASKLYEPRAYMGVTVEMRLGQHKSPLMQARGLQLSPVPVLIAWKRGDLGAGEQPSTIKGPAGVKAGQAFPGRQGLQATEALREQFLI